MPGHLLAFAEELREEGMAVGTSELLDAFAALEQIAWIDQDDFRGALSATLAKSPDDARIFALVFERFFFRAAEAEASRNEISEGSAATAQSLDVDLDELRR
ncbi:MAG: CoxE, partial [Actinomycetota bacterium]|nr:CoxE [Actinomycetota bacterium]